MVTKVVVRQGSQHPSISTDTFLGFVLFFQRMLGKKKVLFQGVQDGYSRWDDSRGVFFFFGKASGTLYLCLMAAVGMIAWSSVIILAFVSSCTSS